MDFLKGQAHFFGPMVSNTKVISRNLKLQGEANLSGQMEVYIKAKCMMGKEKAKGHFIAFQTNTFTPGSGKMA